MVLQLLDPEVEFEAPESLVGGYLPPDMPRIHYGHEGYTRMFEGLLEGGTTSSSGRRRSSISVTASSSPSASQGTGDKAGVALDTALFQVVTLRGGLIVQQKDFADRDAALEAAGMEE